MNRTEVNAFFKTVDIDGLTCPNIDLAEKAIDHFDVRDDIMEVSAIHHSARDFLIKRQEAKLRNERFNREVAREVRG